jgi:hypothetical protein
MAQDRMIVGTVVHSVSIPVFVHNNIQAPVKPVFDPAVRTHQLVEARGGQLRAEQIIRGLHGRHLTRFPCAGDLADAGQTGPFVAVLKPCDVGRDGRYAGFDPRAIGTNSSVDVTDLWPGVVEELRDVIPTRIKIDSGQSHFKKRPTVDGEKHHPTPLV